MEIIAKHGDGRWRIRLLFVAIILCASVCIPVHGEIRWLAKEYDFGSFPEARGLTSGEVRFVNDGPAPTVINRVRLSCGCTSEVHTEGVINPGDTARIRFTYNPAGRPGRFEKTIKVYTGENNDLTTIRMRGTVIGTPQTLEKDYPVAIGPMRLNMRRMDFGNVRYGTSRHQFIVLYNQGYDSIRPHWTPAPQALDVALSTPVVPPGELATISVYLNTRDEDTLGPMEYAFTLFPDLSSTEEEGLEFKVKAVIEPDTQSLSPEQLAAAPVVECSPRNIDLGVIQLSKTARPESYPVSFLLINTGKEQLQVKRIYSRDLPMKLKRFPSSLKGGKNGKTEATVDLRKIPAGPFRVKIEVLTNDPLHPVTSISLTGEIES